MFFDLQFTKAKFLDLLQDQVQRAFPLVSDEFDTPIGKKMIDHLECSSVTIDGTPSRQIAIEGPNGSTTVSGNVVRVMITIQAKLTSREQAIAAGHFGAPSTFPYEIWVKAEISAKAAKNGDIKLAVHPVEIGDAGGVLTAAQKSSLLDKMPSVDQTIALPGVAGHAMNAKNAGLTLHHDVIAIRAELSAPNSNTVHAWKEFFAGNFIVLGHEWAIQLPSELLVDVVDDAITSAVDSFPDKDPKIQVVKEPSTMWLPTGALSTASINSVDACPVGASDIECDLTFTVGFGLHNDSIRVTVDLSWDLNDWDVFRCAAATALLPGAALTVLVGGIFGPIGAIIMAVVTIVGFIVAIVVISDKGHGNLSSGAGGIDPGDMNLHTVEKDDSHAVIQGSVPLGTLLPGMKPTAVVANVFGLLIGGNLNVPSHHERTLKKLSQQAFDWHAYYSCSSFSWVVDQIDAIVTFDDPHTYPLDVMVENLTQPPSAYMVDHHNVQTFSAYVDAASTVEDGTGPNCELLLRTNSGVRYLNLGHQGKQPDPPSPLDMIRDKVACYKQTTPGPKKWLEAHWLVDPGPEGVAEIHIWDGVASQLPAETPVEIAIIDARGQLRTVANMKADHRGQAAFRVATTPGEHIAVHAASDKTALFLAGAAATQVARFTPLTSALDATVIGTGDNARVALTTRDNVMVFGLDGTSLGRASIPGAKHVATVGSRIAVNDGARVMTLAASRAAIAMHGGLAHAPAPHAAPVPLSFTMQPTQSWIAGQEITRLVARGGVMLATLRDGTAVSLDRNLSPIQRAQHAERWISEKSLYSPLHVGTMIARIEDGAVAVYRYRKTAVF